jgi:hypothetical protein
MKIEINDHRKIFEIQKEFSEMFPFLKVDFFGKPHTVKGASPKMTPVGPSKTIGECRSTHTKGILTITPHMTVNELENELRDNFGLSTTVFHKSGTNWLEVSSDMYSLESNNEMAKTESSGTKTVL